MSTTLTTRTRKGKAICSPKLAGIKCIGFRNCIKCELFKRIIEDYTRYVDTGLSPEEVVNLKQNYEKLTSKMNLEHEELYKALVGSVHIN